MADESFLIGKSRVTESYLNIEKILATAKSSGSEAIHSGYGFLSENSEFSHRCEEEGLIFIGPSSSVISSMGRKMGAAAVKAAQAIGYTNAGTVEFLWMKIKIFIFWK